MPTLNNTPYYGGGQQANPANVVQVDNIPSVKLTDADLGTIAVDNAHNRAYMLTSKLGGVSSWTTVGTLSGGGVAVLSADTGVAAPNLGNISISGTNDQITTTASLHAITLSLPTDLVAPGSITATDNITSNGNILGSSVTATHDITSSFGDLKLTQGKLVIPAAPNASVGTATLVGGTATISTNQVTALSLVFLTNAAPSGTPGILSVGTIVPGISFIINSTSSLDTSHVNWWIIN